MAKELENARAAAAEGASKLKESESKKTLLKTALGELNETTTRYAHKRKLRKTWVYKTGKKRAIPKMKVSFRLLYKKAALYR